ncbi:PEP-CTERM sorting domain-containing protein [Aestuariispira insulae]|uniref:Putative secreted protein with PEP-CTERM sorting signal n=1 Tax=Aestuariispira insulae TaxID=1461337 RepID=A0A3D9H9P8_9PROT|nr:PEP-CTERM sorting domain-containing protein [Aestuariispira insulae]RED46205.1 putative secreted protein with PEP-CTERM sorting signal [Aestuariispira insulae]
MFRNYSTRLLAGIVAIGTSLAIMGSSQAALLGFDLTWQASQFAQGSATARLVIDDTVLPNPHPIDEPPLSASHWGIVQFDLTVTGTPMNDGVYHIDDFGSFIFDTTQYGLDLTQELVGQAVGTKTWGVQSWEGGLGNFNFYKDGQDPGPFGIGLFSFDTNFGDNRSNILDLVSFTPSGEISVPEPAVLSLMGIGLLAMGAARRRKK